MPPLPSMRKAIVRGALLVAALSVVSCEEADAGTTTTTANAGKNIAGFTTTNDATEYAKITIDIKDIETEMKKDNMAGYPEAMKIFREGKNSKKSETSFRTLEGMGVRKDEPFGKLYDDYSKVVADGRVGYTPHDSVLAALNGTDGDYGKYATGSISNKPDFRSQVVKKTIKFQVLQLYALHELESAFGKYKKGDSATLALDEWWAFYAGEGETGTASGTGPYILPEKRSAFFGTGGRTVSNGGVSRVNQLLLAGTKEIQTLMLVKGNDAKIDNIIKCMRAQLKVGLIQGCIQYVYKTDKDSKYPGDPTNAAAQGETWAFCSGVLPFLHEVSAADAATLRAETDLVPDNSKNPSFSKVKAVFSAKNLNAMGLSCKDIGGFVPGKDTSLTTEGDDFKTCNDGTISNMYADTTKCTGTWAESAGSAAHRHTASFLSMAASFLLSAALIMRN